jgi:hypothetical protein
MNLAYINQQIKTANAALDTLNIIHPIITDDQPYIAAQHSIEKAKLELTYAIKQLTRVYEHYQGEQDEKL